MDYNLTLSQIKTSYSYHEYRSKVAELIHTNSCTGNEQTEERIEFTRLNDHRMNRVEKQFKTSDELNLRLNNLQCDQIWIILLESWCGDAAQSLPVIAKIAEATPNIELKIILRDEHPEIMDQYLTNGGKAIPKLICFDKHSGDEIGSWGPRPEGIQELVKEFKTSNPDASHEEFVSNLHLWYGKDRGKMIQQDFTKVIQQWSDRCRKVLMEVM